jgi:hypothetical protein
VVDVALGVHNEVVGFAQLHGALWWHEWPQAGLARESFFVRDFQQLFPGVLDRVIDGGGTIFFRLDDISDDRPMTYWELVTVTSNTRWRDATRFFLKGKELDQAQLEVALGAIL